MRRDREDGVWVATSGTCDLDERCATCGKPMLYVAADDDRIVGRFCQNVRCSQFLEVK